MLRYEKEALKIRGKCNQETSAVDTAIEMEIGILTKQLGILYLKIKAISKHLKVFL